MGMRKGGGRKGKRRVCGEEGQQGVAGEDVGRGRDKCGGCEGERKKQWRKEGK